MTRRHSPETCIVKAEKALSAARLLAKAKDADGACNRAYYAMFDAAHAALFALGVEGLTRQIKTHHGLVARFGQEVIAAGRLPSSMATTSTRLRDFACWLITTPNRSIRPTPVGPSNAPRRSWLP